MREDIQQAVKILNQGGIVIFPTDTVFGIGCRIDNEKAIERLFKIRKRPVSQAAPVLVSSLAMAKEYLKPIPKDVIEKLIKPYWPGQLTIVLPCLVEKIPELVRGGSGNLGVRMPNHKIILDIIKSVGVPILGPSANFHGKKTPYAYQDLDKELIKQVNFVVKGKCPIKQTSTVIDCSISPWKILRKGAIELKIMKTILHIDTTSNEIIKIGLNISGEGYFIKQKLDKKKAQIVLPLIERILKRKNLKLKDISEIKINPGPGSFTGIRVGLTVANTLGFLLKIPINGKQVGKMVEPVY